MPEREFELRPVRQLDRGALCDFGAEVWGESGRDEILDRWWLRSDFAAAMGAVAADGTIAGLCVGVPSDWQLPGQASVRAISICGWFVSPRFSGRGLGKTLVQSFADEAPCMNALSISEAAVRNFAKLGWVGPFQTWLRLLPLPLLRRRRLDRESFEISSFTASAAAMPEALAAALDAIDSGKPADQLRRRRRAEDWRAHLSARPRRRPQFHILSRAGRPLAYFMIRGTDEEAGPLYRRARLHYVSDLVVNEEDNAELLRFTFRAMARAAPPTAGALLLCTSSRRMATAAEANGWLSERSPIIGPRLAAKAPLYMLGGGFVPLAGDDFRLTFADSDVDLNI